MANVCILTVNNTESALYLDGKFIDSAEKKLQDIKHYWLINFGKRLAAAHDSELKQYRHEINEETWNWVKLAAQLPHLSPVNTQS